MNGRYLLQGSGKWPWDVVRTPDGGVVMTRSPKWHRSMGWEVVAFAIWFSCIFGFLLYASRPQPQHPAGPNPATTFGLLGIPLVCWCLAAYVFLFREEWQAQPGLMVMRKHFLGFLQVREFRDGELQVDIDRFCEPPSWRLSVKASRAACSFAFVSLSVGDWRPTTVGILAQALREATGFPLKDELGVVDDLGLSPASAGLGPSVPVRRLHTGQILEQIPGSSLVGANLAGFQFEGADFQGTDLRTADLTGAHLEGASLKGAKLMNVKLMNAVLTAADLSGADLTGATLSGAKLTAATYDASTRWPAGFDPVKHGAVLVK